MTSGTAPIWSRPQPGPRRPRYTREQLATAALAVADAEGIDAVSMRRIAAELGAGTMTLYHYVKSKADLQALMSDAIMAEMLLGDDALEGGWRTALTAIAERTRATFVRHPWAVNGLPDNGFSPHALRHFEQSLAAVAGTGLDPADRLEIIATVDAFVAGFVAKNDVEPGIESAGTDTIPQLSAYLDEQLASGGFPHTSALVGQHDRWRRLTEVFGRMPSVDDRFALGLAALLDGLSARLGIDAQ